MKGCQQVPGQGLLPDRVGPEGGPDQRAGARLGRRQPPHLRKTPPPRSRCPACRRTHRWPRWPGRRWWSHPPRPPATRSRTPPPHPGRRPGPRPRRTACAPDRPPAGPGHATARRCSGSATTGPRPRPPTPAGPTAAPPATAHRDAGDTTRPPACPAPAHSRSYGPGTATTPTRSTPPAGPAAAGAAPHGYRSSPRPDPPTPAGTPSSTPPPTPGRATSPAATILQTHHAAQPDHLTR